MIMTGHEKTNLLINLKLIDTTLYFLSQASHYMLVDWAQTYTPNI